MRVCKHGNYETDIQVICPNCDCIFTYKKKELLTAVNYSFADNQGSAIEFVSCPECTHKYITKSATLMPEQTEERIYDDEGNEEL